MIEPARNVRARLRVPGAIFVAAILMMTSPAFGAPMAGRSLESVLEELQQDGLKLIYSSSLVLPEMRVENEPRERSSRGMLDEILAPHGLAVKEQSGHWIVVPARAESTGTIRLTVAAGAARVTVQIDAKREVRLAPGRPFLLELPAGVRSLLIEARGCMPVRIDDFLVVAGQTRELEVTLTAVVPLLEEVTVTPSHYRLVDRDPHASRFLSVAEAERLPQVAGDPYWAAKTLPGTAHSDSAAAFHIRGGGSDEMLVLLDGVELYEPFHLKDLLPLFSIIDQSAIAGIDVTTGGFSAEYGGRMSGVMSIATRGASPLNPISVRLSTTDSSVVVSGVMEERPLHYLAAVRAWYPDDVLRAAGVLEQPIVTDYFDFLGKVTYPWGARTTVGAGTLGAYDHARYVSSGTAARQSVTAQDSTLQLWARADTLATPALTLQTSVSAGELRRDRKGDAAREAGIVAVADERSFSFAGIRHDGSFDLGDRHLLRWGMELKSQRASYDFHSHLEDSPARFDVGTSPRGESWSGYFSDRIRLGPSLVGEAGVRFDRQHWIEDQQISPRLSLLYSLSRDTLLRAAWGRYSQWQQLNELPVADGESEFAPAQRADHWLVSAERRFPSFTGRIELYEKVIQSPNPYHENLFDHLDLFPESREDRILVESEHARSRGIELFLRSDPAPDRAWWASYALSEATDRIEGRTVPRSWDERHALSFGVFRSLPRGWEASLAGNWSSGRPGTEMRARRAADGIELVPGPRNAIRRSSHHRIDGRVSKRFRLRGGTIVLAAELLNLTGRANVCCITGFTVEEGDAGELTVHADERMYPRLVPSLSLRWDF